MLVRHHEPLGDPSKKQDPLPENWESIAADAGHLPNNFGTVEPGKLYRSGIVWPNQVRKLKEDFGIEHIISLLDGDWLQDFYYGSAVTIHQFPFHRRRALTFDRVRDIVTVINDLDKPALVHCYHGATRTGMVCAGYQIINGRKGRFRAILESVRYRNVNISSFREMRHYMP